MVKPIADTGQHGHGRPYEPAEEVETGSILAPIDPQSAPADASLPPIREVLPARSWHQSSAGDYRVRPCLQTVHRNAASTVKSHSRLMCYEAGRNTADTFLQRHREDFVPEARHYERLSGLARLVIPTSPPSPVSVGSLSNGRPLTCLPYHIQQQQDEEEHEREMLDPVRGSYTWTPINNGPIPLHPAARSRQEVVTPLAPTPVMRRGQERHAHWRAMGSHVLRCDFCNERNMDGVLQKCCDCTITFCRRCVGRINAPGDRHYPVIESALDWEEHDDIPVKCHTPVGGMSTSKARKTSAAAAQERRRKKRQQRRKMGDLGLPVSAAHGGRSNAEDLAKKRFADNLNSDSQELLPSPYVWPLVPGAVPPAASKHVSFVRNSLPGVGTTRSFSQPPAIAPSPTARSVHKRTPLPTDRPATRRLELTVRSSSSRPPPRLESTTTSNAKLRDIAIWAREIAAATASTGDLHADQPPQTAPVRAQPPDAGVVPAPGQRPPAANSQAAGVARLDRRFQPARGQDGEGVLFQDAGRRRYPRGIGYHRGARGYGGRIRKEGPATSPSEGEGMDPQTEGVRPQPHAERGWAAC